MVDWLQPTVLLLPFAAWMFLGVGAPWALALLPRELWEDRVTVIAVGMALGPLGFTTVMFLLGSAGYMTLELTLVGSLAVAAAGALLARARKDDAPAPSGLFVRVKPLTQIEQLLIAGMTVVLLSTVIVAAYWPFVAYDPLWVYAYNAKIFVMEEAIPDDIGYYPQLVPLGYSYMQQAWGSIDDHAARVIVPWFNVGMTLMAYTLGRLVFGSRRVGLLTAAIWTFYPHVAAWSGAGDLEIPLTLYMTGASIFFIQAWRSHSARTAILAGLLLAGGLWTKPTAGALALGVVLAVIGRAVIMRFDWALTWPKLRVALIMGAASAPLGGMWYVRNLLLGHPAVTFPADYWHGFAQRSGQELGWPLLLLLLFAGALIGYPPVWLRGTGRWARIVLPLLAAGLLLAGALPTALNLDTLGANDNVWHWLRGDLSAGGSLTLTDTLLLLAGFALLVWMGRGVWQMWPDAQRETVLLLWGLALPYGMVWFWNFSYHYRLSFAIVPLFAVQVAALLEGWVWDWLDMYRLGRQLAWVLAVTAIVIALMAGLEFTADYWLQGGADNDRAKYDKANPAFMRVVHMLERESEAAGKPLVVSIPGEDRLPFFFPTWDIRNSRAYDELPVRVEDLAGVDVFVENSIYVFLLQQADKSPNSLLAEADLGAAYHAVRPLTVDGEWQDSPGWPAIAADGTPWPTVLEPIPLHPTGAVTVDDGNFRYRAYTIHPEARATPLEPIAAREEEVIAGDVAQFVGHNVGSLAWQRGARISLTLYWRPLRDVSRNYDVTIDLLSPDEDLLARWRATPLQGEYPTVYWRPGALLLDYWLLVVPADVPPGPAMLRVGLVDAGTGERLPVTVAGQPAGDSITLQPLDFAPDDTWITVR